MPYQLSRQLQYIPSMDILSTKSSFTFSLSKLGFRIRTYFPFSNCCLRSHTLSAYQWWTQISANIAVSSINKNPPIHCPTIAWHLLWLIPTEFPIALGATSNGCICWIFAVSGPSKLFFAILLVASGGKLCFRKSIDNKGKPSACDPD